MFPKFFNPIEALSLHEFAFGTAFSLIYWPLAIIFYGLNTGFRCISQALCNLFYPGRYKIADGEDSVFGVKLHGSSKSYINGYKIIRGKPDINLIRSKVEHVVTTINGYEKLAHVITDKFGYFCWDTKVPFDVTRHVRYLDDFNLEDIVDETKLIDICAKLVNKEHGEDRPQWEVLMIPKFRPDGESDSQEISHYALIIRLHHAYCDGISFVLLTNDYLADEPGELPIDPKKGFNNPIWIKAYIWAKMFLVGPYNFFKNLCILVFSSSNYRVERYLATKVLARSSPVEMDVLKRIRLASGASTTSITLAAVYGALYKTHKRIFPGKPVPDKMHLGSIGVMLPYREDRRLVNQFTMARYTANLKVDDPKERLQQNYAEIRKAASQPDPIFNFFMQKALGSLPKIWHEILFALSGTPVMLSNVPGYKTPVKIFGGELVDVTAWIPLITTTGIGLSTQSYCGKLRFSAIVDPQMFTTAADLKLFLEDIVNEINVLADAYGVRNAVITNLSEPTKVQKECEGQFEETIHLQNRIVEKDMNENEPTITMRSSPQIASEWVLSPSAKSEVVPLQCRKRKDDPLDGLRQLDIRREISI